MRCDPRRFPSWACSGLVQRHAFEHQHKLWPGELDRAFALGQFQRSLFQPLVPEHISTVLEEQQLDAVATSTDEHEHFPAQGVAPKLIAHNTAERVHSFAHVLNYWFAKSRRQGTAGFAAVEFATGSNVELHYPNGVRMLLPVGTALDHIAACIRLY